MGHRVQSECSTLLVLNNTPLFDYPTRHMVTWRHHNARLMITAPALQENLRNAITAIVEDSYMSRLVGLLQQAHQGVVIIIINSS